MWYHAHNPPDDWLTLTGSCSLKTALRAPPVERPLEGGIWSGGTGIGSIGGATRSRVIKGSATFGRA